MKRSEDRILTTHTGFLFLPPEEGGRVRPTEPEAVKAAVRKIVDYQFDAGIDIVSNGDLLLGPAPFDYPSWLNGVETVPRTKEDQQFILGYPNVDIEQFRSYYRTHPFIRGFQVENEDDDASLASLPPFIQVTTGELSPKSTEAIELDINALVDAMGDRDLETAFLCVQSPGWMTEMLYNDYYKTREEFIFALAESMKPFYKAVVDSGLLLQVDTPDTVDLWSWGRFTDIKEYRKDLEMRIEALNGALEGLPPEKIRYHVCWGSHAGPHSDDLALGEVIDLVLKINAQTLSLEAAKPNHHHEWKVFKDHKLPDGKILAPGVVDHTTPVLEHPEVIADRIVQYANLVGKENVQAGTDCGHRVDPAVDWAKYASMVEGAKLASEQLWK